MSSSTLPHLLSNYLPSYEQNEARPDGAAPVSEQLEQNTDVQKKPKRTVMAHKRQIEAVEKASKEREEKALHTFELWNIVKANERKRKLRMLKDRVNLQHQMIKKQDKLTQEKQLQEKESQKQHVQERFQRRRMLTEKLEKVESKNKSGSKKPNKTTKKNVKTMLETPNEEAPQKICEEEKIPEVPEKDAFSEEDLLEFLEKSTIEDADFHGLRYQPLQVQLETLFGDSEANGYLNPTVKESPRKTFDLALARKKGQHGAAALWESLRAYSRQKLVNKDALILPDVKNAYACFVRECLRRHVTPVKRNFVSEENPVNVNIEESDILRDVKYRRHRQELMYRIAHVNKDKTRFLFQVVGASHYPEETDENGIKRYYPEGRIEESPSLLKLPQIQERLTPGRTWNKQKIKGEEQYPQPRSKLVFLTEKKATCKGQFSKRLNKEEKAESNYLKQADVLRESKTSSPVYSQRVWEPLSMQALLDHKVSVLEKRNEVSGLDSSQMWNVCT